MIVYFLRHSEAEDSPEDFGRRLTPKGSVQSEKMGRFMKQAGLIPSKILSSPVVRARQTAEIVCALFGDAKVEIAPWLACGMSPSDFFKNMAVETSTSGILLVGHEPDFSSTIGALLGCEGDSLHIRKASLTCLSVSAFSKGGGRLEFSLPVKIL
jgi:phosphohistidine phosphatase